jgi:hypothetical protein
MELQATSKAYSSLVSGSSSAKDKLTSSVGVPSEVAGFVQFVLYGVDSIHESYPSHSIMLLRNLASTVKYAFVKLLQDAFRVTECSSCPHELTEGLRVGLTYIGSLLKFLYENVDHDGDSAHSSFDLFYSKNQGAVQAEISMSIK